MQFLLQYESCSGTQNEFMLYLTRICNAIRFENGEAIDRLLCAEQVQNLGSISGLLLIYNSAKHGYERVIRTFI